MKNKYIIFLLVLVAISAAFIYATITVPKPIYKQIKKTDKKIKKQQEILNSAKVLSRELSGVSNVIKNSISDSKKITPEEVNAFVKRISELADELKIALVSIKPTESMPSKPFVEQEYIIDIKTTYVQMGQFLSKIESFNNLVKFNSINVKPIGTKKSRAAAKQVENSSDTRYRVTLEIVTTKIVKES